MTQREPSHFRSITLTISTSRSAFVAAIMPYKATRLGPNRAEIITMIQKKKTFTFHPCRILTKCPIPSLLSAQVLPKASKTRLIGTYVVKCVHQGVCLWLLTAETLHAVTGMCGSHQITQTHIRSTYHLTGAYPP